MGSSLIGLLLGVVILAGIAAVVLASTEGGNGRGSSEENLSIGSGTTLRAVPGAASADIAAAAVMACQTDYQAVIEAVSYYEAVNGHRPASMGDLSTILKNAPISAYFTISIDPVHTGQVDVATKNHPASAGDANCAYAG